ncbi:MAG: hypothetical protein HY027_09010 [Deltaproteobacteria bacterium]|nr:hypothetical protein [Deltaproteobacteria bacterium]
MSVRELIALVVAGCLIGCGPRLITSGGVNADRVAAIEQAIATLRGRPFVPAANVAVLDSAAMGAVVTRLRLSDDSRRILGIWATIDHAFGDDQTDALDSVRRLPTDTSFGVYSPADDTVFIARARLDTSLAIGLREFLSGGQALAEIVLTHELAHAWQRRHFAALFAPTTDVDEWTAHQAVIEGDAEVTTLALTQHAIDAGALEAYLAMRRRMAVAAGQHPDTNRDWQLRYDRATRALCDVARGRGWAALNALLANPPETTAAILDPEAATSTATDAIDEPLTCPVGWDRAVDTGVGAFHIPPLLQLKTGPLLAMDGWRSDRLQICVRAESSDFAWRWQSRWADDAAAERFHMAGPIGDDGRQQCGRDRDRNAARILR